ncbi:MAG: hypothetical protein KZQ60_02145, partial [Candidatus Thiodiazotropha sp. (ex Lucinoma aequizonata)]|nr:hypothetical protein [Candidatus Thiodiazotropha sp. (ex Lucinoma aequizonata)]
LGCALCMPFISPFRSPFRPYNRAYAYRGLTTFAPLSMAVSGGIKPTVRKVTKSYRKRVTVAKKAMLGIESRLERTTGLEHWFIKIAPQS